MYRMWLFVVLLMLSQSVLAEEGNKVRVFVAASLSTVMAELSEVYGASSDTKLIEVYAASSTLARQIYQGAPADIYISANQKWMDYLGKNDLLSKGSRVNLLRNELVLISYGKAPQPLTNWSMLATRLKSGRLAMGDPDHVPAGIYAQEALTSLGIWPEIKGRLARTNHVRAALALVERGEAEFGIVYRTDALNTEKVTLLNAFPKDSHQLIEYPMSLIKGDPNQRVVDFYQFLQSAKAKAIYEKYGFDFY